MRAKKRLSLMSRLILLSSAIVLSACGAICVYSYRATYNRLLESDDARSALIRQTMAQEILIGTAQVEKVVEELASSREILEAAGEKDPDAFIVQMISGAEQQIRLSESHLANDGADIVLILAGRPESYELTLDENRFRSDASYTAFAAGKTLQAWGAIGPSLPTVEAAGTVIPLYRRIVSGGGRTLGAIRCDVAADKLFQGLKQWTDGVYVMSGNRAVYFSGEQRWPVPQMRGGTAWQEGQYLYASVDMAGLSAALLFRQDLSPLTRQAWTDALVSMGLILGVGLLVMVAAGYLISKMLRRINLMTRAVNNMPESGKLSDMLPAAGPDEAGQLSEAFASLNARVNEYYGRLLQAEKSKRHAQQLALQYQINPHFLFNSLYWLQMRLEEEQNDPALSDAIAQLGQVLHYNLESTFSASLREERELAEAYVRFMSAVKDGAILLEMSLPDGLAETLIPRFTLQPILENAITHGFAPDRPLHLRMAFAAEGGRLAIRLDNDGRPIPPDRLEAVRRLLAREPDGNGDAGVGLSNLKRRLSLVYGEGLTMDISSGEGLTTVSIAVPLSLPPGEQEAAT